MKKKIIVLGSSGLIGHMTCFYLNKVDNFKVYNVSGSRKYNDDTEIINALNFEKIKQYIKKIQPHVVVNCIGILINQCKTSTQNAIFLNALFPHLLNELSFDLNFKLIHISTDCVFSGEKGESYIESDLKDGKGTYAKTKGLGEINNNKNLTLRTSVIGPELKKNGEELFSWFMSQNKEINGFTNVYWSGVSTIELAKTVIWGIRNNIKGLYHVTNGQKISKNDLLSIINKYSNKNISINPDSSMCSDKSFIDTRKERDYLMPSYELMIKELFVYMKQKHFNYTHYLN